LENAASPELGTFALRLAATLFFVVANGFFVAAEFALVKVRPTQLRERALRDRRARTAHHVRAHLDLYLSACQLGITLSSLILGWLAEPAVAQLLLVGAGSLGIGLDPADPLLHALALAVALSIITFLHMTLGEQAPKIWAINRADTLVVHVAYPLQLFANAFRPFIWLINACSNAMLRLVGMTSDEIADSSHSVEELRSILAASAEEGHISGRQLELAENVFTMIDLEVRHILVPRVDVEFLSLQRSTQENLQVIHASGHSRFPLCEVGLDSVIGIVHAKDVMRAVASGGELDLKTLVRRPIFAPDTQPLARLIARMQRTRSHCAVVVDEHGTAVGLAFLEDALEEIVGPIRDEFDEDEQEVRDVGGGVLELPGSLALPEAADRLGVDDLGEESDTIGGYVVARLGRLPRVGDALSIGRFRVTVAQVEQHRVLSLRCEPQPTPVEAPAADEEPLDG
jgi:CBS domain containing-hemolysin-like protein